MSTTKWWWQEESKRQKVKRFLPPVLILGVAGVAGVARCYQVARPGEYLVLTGWKINASHGMHVSRKCIQLPFLQTLTHVSIQPQTFHFDLKCLSQQYLPFVLPVTYVLAPVLPTDAGVKMEDGREMSGEDAFKQYVQKIASLGPRERDHCIQSVIHGETRVLTSKMPIDDLNDDRQQFQANVTDCVQKLLTPLGLKILSVNIAEIVETTRPDGVSYLGAREAKKLTGALQLMLRKLPNLVILVKNNEKQILDKKLQGWKHLQKKWNSNSARILQMQKRILE